jgi:N-methylhydantoinase B
MFHNDPMWDGSHIADCCTNRCSSATSCFLDGEQGHMADSGGPAPGSYNPEAREIYAEGLRIPPIKLHEAGQRSDVLNLLLVNTRTRATRQATSARSSVPSTSGRAAPQALVDRYGRDEIRACVTHLLDLAEGRCGSGSPSSRMAAFEGSRFVRTSATAWRAGSASGSRWRAPDLRHPRQPRRIPFYTIVPGQHETSAVYLGLSCSCSRRRLREGHVPPGRDPPRAAGTLVKPVEPGPTSPRPPARRTITDAVRDSAAPT